MAACGASIPMTLIRFLRGPHAHNLESGLKLDLSSGRLYFGHQYASKSISTKRLEFIRSAAANQNIALPPLVS